MKAIRTHLAIALLTLSSSMVLAADLEIKAPWARGTVVGQQATGAFMELTSTAGATLIGVSSTVAGISEVHEMKMDGGMMKMRAVGRLDLPAGQPVKLAPGSYHIMLMDLKQQLKTGDLVPLTLKIEGKDKTVETIEIKAEVRSLTAAAPAMHHDQKH